MGMGRKRDTGAYERKRMAGNAVLIVLIVATLAAPVLVPNAGSLLLIIVLVPVGLVLFVTVNRAPKGWDSVGVVRETRVTGEFRIPAYGARAASLLLAVAGILLAANGFLSTQYQTTAMPEAYFTVSVVLWVLAALISFVTDPVTGLRNEQGEISIRRRRGWEPLALRAFREVRYSGIVQRRSARAVIRFYRDQRQLFPLEISLIGVVDVAQNSPVETQALADFFEARCRASGFVVDAQANGAWTAHRGGKGSGGKAKARR